MALEPAVSARILDSMGASSKFWVDQPGSQTALIFFAKSEQPSYHAGKPNLVWELYFQIVVVLFRTCSASAQPSFVCVVESTHDWQGVFLGQRSPVFSRVSFVFFF